MKEIIYQYLCQLFGEADVLATYLDGRPAVFDTKAPDDLDESWNDGVQYPRCIYELNMQANAERKVSGQLFVDVMCENTQEAMQESISPEQLAVMVKEAVDGCFFSNSDLTISAQWSSSDNFSQDDSNLAGITITFDIMAYPVQETESPDPIAAVNLWLKTLYQNAYVIGRDTLPDVWKPTDDSPALYCRLTNLGAGRMKSTAAVTWIGADMRVNIIAPSEKVRATISKNSVQILENATRLILDDGSPMLIDRVSADISADPLREGQLYIKATYGVLNTYTGTPLRSVTLKGMSSESEVKHG